MKRTALLLLTYYITSLIYAADDTGILNPKTKWKFKTQGCIRGTVTVRNEYLYFGSADGYVYALHKNTGALNWKFATGGAVNTTPAVSNDLIIVASHDNNIYAIRADGQLSWKFSMQPMLQHYWEWDYFSSSPLIAGNRVYIGSGDGYLYALELKTGKLAWKFKTNGRIRCTPLLHEGVIYQPSNDGMVYALNTEGKLLWSFETRGAKFDSRKFGFDRNSIYASPVIKDSLLIIASRDGRAYAINIHTRKEKWTFFYDGTWAMSTIIDHDAVYVGWSTNNTFCSIDLQTGKERWKFKCGSVIYTTGLVRGNEIVFGSADEKIYCLDKISGLKKWEYRVGGKIFSSPAEDMYTFYTGSDDGFLYAIEEGPKPYKAVFQPVPRHSSFNYYITDPSITPYLKERGFEHLDSAGLYRFISARVQDKRPSVIVFAFERIPDNILGTRPAEGMIRQYLDAGGKIIWFGSIPNLYSFDEKGTPVKQIEKASQLLEVEFNREEESGNYYNKATQEGLNWGLPAWYTITYANINPASVIPLAIDEFGRASAWIKRFHPRPGSGFVSCRSWGWDSPIKQQDLELIHGLAVYGLE